MWSALTDSIAQLAAWSGFFLGTIELLTAVMSLGGGVVILLLRREILPEERWATYFGWAFMVFALQYFPQALAVRISALATLGWDPSWWNPDWGALVYWVQRVAHGLASPANNLLFLACANSLLGYEHQPEPRGWVARPWLSVLFRRGVAWFPISRLAWFLAAITLVGQFCPDTFGQRLPDALFSAACLLKLGWAMYVNFSPRRQPGLAWICLFGAMSYGGVNLIYCLNPFLAQARLWPELTSRLQIQLQRLPPESGMFVEPLLAFDGAAFAMALFLKVFVFLGALLLIIKCLTLFSPWETREQLGAVQDRRIEAVVAPRLVNALGQSVAADRVAIYYRIPGVLANEIFWLAWQPGSSQPILSTKPMPEPTTLIGRVLATGQEITTSDYRSDPILPNSYGIDTKTRALVAIPIFYQGAVIGGLQLEWKSPSLFTATTVQRIRQVADLLVPVLAARRKLLALDQLSRRLHRVRSSALGWGRESVSEMLQIIQDVLASMAIGLHLTSGFRTVVMVCTDAGDTQILPESTTESALQALLAPSATGQDTGSKPDIFTFKLKTQTGQTESLVGQLLVAVPGGKDPKDRPALVTDFLYRKTVASLVADTLLEFIQVRLDACLIELQAKLNSPDALSPKGWQAALEIGAKEVGLLWALGEVPAAHADREMTLLGDEIAKVWVRSAQNWPSSGEESLQLRISPAGESPAVPPRLLRLKLTAAQGYLWLGVAQSNFHDELQWPSPWKRFLFRLADVADAAWLIRERQRLEAVAGQVIRIATRAESSRLWRHEGGNLAAKFSLATERVKVALKRNDLTEAARQVADLKEIAGRFTQLAAAFNKPTLADARSVIPLHDPLVLLGNLYQTDLKARLIELEITDSSLEVLMPFEVVLLALYELVTNAATAIQTGGSIQIEAEDIGSEILCHVTNTGPEIDPCIRDRILEPGTTTKAEGGGWGLAEIRFALARDGGSIELAHSTPGDTRFTLRFPKPSSVENSIWKPDQPDQARGGSRWMNQKRY